MVLETFLKRLLADDYLPLALVCDALKNFFFLFFLSRTLKTNFTIITAPRISIFCVSGK